MLTCNTLPAGLENRFCSVVYKNLIWTDEECGDFGEVVEVFLPRASDGDDAGVGKAFVEFTSELDARRAAAGIAGRSFDGNVVMAAFLDEIAYDEGRLDDHTEPTAHVVVS